MTLLTVVRDVCASVGVDIPTSVFSNINNNRTMAEMLALANEVAQRIAFDTRDWVVLREIALFHGDGATFFFLFPNSYKRLLLASNVWRSTSTLTPMRFIPDPDEWVRRRNANITDPRGEWILSASNAGTNIGISIFPVMLASVTASVVFLANACVKLASGGTSDSFISDGDTFVIDERILKLGMIWQWKASHGSPYAEDMSSYETALARVAGADTPAPIIVGRLPISSTARVAYPWPVPTP